MTYPGGYPFKLRYCGEKDFEDVNDKTEEELMEDLAKAFKMAFEGSPEDQARRKRKLVMEELKKEWVREEVRKMDARKRSHILAKRKKAQNPSPKPLAGPSRMLKSAGTLKWEARGLHGRLSPL